MKIIKLLILFIFIILFYCFSLVEAYDDRITHPEISRKAVINSSLNSYLKSNLGLKDGINAKVPSNGEADILALLRKGSTDEDDPKCRASNHFHNPTLPWGLSYMTDDTDTVIGTIFVRNYCNNRGWDFEHRKSAVTWATGYLNPAPDGAKETYALDPEHHPIDWDTARDNYYKALTYPTKQDQEFYFAETFSAVGHVMHILQDMAVPAHTRNDMTSHLPDTHKGWSQPYENYVKRYPSLIVNSNPQPTDFPNFSNTRVTDFWDTTAGNSNLLTGNSVGLAEFSNANYLSDYTIPTNPHLNSNHAFSSPKITTDKYQICEKTILNAKGEQIRQKYVGRKNMMGSGCDAFAVVTAFNSSSYTATTTTLNANISRLNLALDASIHVTYAKELIPRAIGYSAGLLDYFFRGKIRLIPDSSNSNPYLNSYVIRNKSTEDMSGTFEIYYDAIDGKRKQVGLGVFPLDISADSDSSPVIFVEPFDAQELGKYILVFRGTMGNENGAVVGWIPHNALEITAPDRCLYSIIDGSVIPQQFRKIKAKVRNATADEPLQAGTLRAVAQYKKRTDYQPDLSTDPPSADSREPGFSSSKSVEIDLTADDIAALNNSTPKEFTFDFSADPIPSGITDLYLQVIFEGTTSNNTDTIIAVGRKDLSEPMHHAFMNWTDRFYLDGVPRTAVEINNNPAFYARASASGRPIDPYPLRTEISFCPVAGHAPTVIYDAMPAGSFGRLIIIVGADPTEFPLTVHRVSVTPPDEKTTNFTSPNIVNQDVNGVFNPAAVYTIRGVKNHGGSAYENYYPYSTGVLEAPWPNMLDLNPIAVTEINP